MTNRVSSDLAILAAVVLAALVPFLDKAVHVDDPLFLWSARHIQERPLDPLGLDVNWYGRRVPMPRVRPNPPLTNYYLALAAALLGWSERALHASMLVPALGAACGTYLLARRWCQRPLFAALVAVLSPIFLVSASTLMCDMTLLCCWVWAVVLWDQGLEPRRAGLLAGAAVLVALAALSKFTGLALVPLLGALAVARRRRLGPELLLLLLPLAAVAGYDVFSRRMYDVGLVWNAASAAGWSRAGGPLAARLLGRLIVTLAFIGPMGLMALPALPALVPRRVAFALAAVLCGGVALAGVLPAGWIVELAIAHVPDTAIAQQLVAWAILGTGIGALAAWDAARTRGVEALTLLLWTGGILVFAAYVNWTTNARSVLPLAPAVGILLARRLDQRGGAKDRGSRGGLAAGLALAAGLSLVALRADAAIAASSRDAARQLVEQQRAPGRTVWFTGHWGFQWYAMEAGALPLDVSRLSTRQGDVVLIPPARSNASVAAPQDPRAYPVVDRLEVAIPGWLATMDQGLGAGFYSHYMGPLPFSFGSVPPHEYLVRQRAPESP